MPSIIYNGYNLDNRPNWGVSKLDMGNFPMRGSNPVPVQIDGSFFVPKYKDELKTTIYMWANGENNIMFLANTVFSSGGGQRDYTITIGSTIYSYQGEVRDLHYSLEAPTGFARITVDIVVATP